MGPISRQDTVSTNSSPFFLRFVGPIVRQQLEHIGKSAALAFSLYLHLPYLFYFFLDGHCDGHLVGGCKNSCV